MPSDDHGYTFAALTDTPVKWCRDRGLGPGDRLEVRVQWPKEWVEVRITALGEEAVMVRLEGRKEWLIEAGLGVRLPKCPETALAGRLTGDLGPAQVGLPADGQNGPGERRAARGQGGEMNEKQVELARHALGLDGRRKALYLNHFCTGPGPGNDDHPQWMAMVEVGYAVKRSGSQLTGGDDLFRLTLAGARAALRPGERLDPEDFPEEGK